MMMLSLALFAMSTQQQTASAAPKRATARDPNRITCINRVRTGSRTNFEQICHTQAEWEQIRSENRRVIERGQNRGLKDRSQG